MGTKYYEYGENKTEQAAKAYWEKIRADDPKPFGRNCTMTERQLDAFNKKRLTLEKRRRA